MDLIITLFKSQGYLTEHECSTNWGDYKSTKIQNQNKSNYQMLVFEENRKPAAENPGKMFQPNEEHNNDGIVAITLGGVVQAGVNNDSDLPQLQPLPPPLPHPTHPNPYPPPPPPLLRKKAFEMSSFQFPLQKLSHYI